MAMLTDGKGSKSRALNVGGGNKRRVLSHPVILEESFVLTP